MEQSFRHTKNTSEEMFFVKLMIIILLSEYFIIFAPLRAFEAMSNYLDVIRIYMI